MALDARNNDMYEYRLVIHRLTAPNEFIEYLHNYRYSFLWKQSTDSYSISTDQYEFDKKLTLIFVGTYLNVFFNLLNNGSTNNVSQSNILTDTKLFVKSSLPFSHKLIAFPGEHINIFLPCCNWYGIVS